MRSEKFKLTLKLHKVSVQIENTINIICFELKPCMGTVVPVFTKSLQTFKALKKKGICNRKKMLISAWALYTTWWDCAYLSYCLGQALQVFLEYYLNYNLSILPCCLTE